MRGTILLRWDAEYPFRWGWSAFNGYGLQESGEATSPRRASRAARASIRRMGKIKASDAE